MSAMGFEIDLVGLLNIDDNEIIELLSQVYDAGVFTQSDDAITLFEPSAVRKRGVLIAAREMQYLKLAGKVVVVPSPDSPARRLSVK